jgi:ribose 1,5-bisphosphokinase PhnN
MRWPWRRASIRSNVKAMELQAAMEILAEVFGTRPGEVEEMIQRRLEERSEPEEYEEGRWPAAFCL